MINPFSTIDDRLSTLEGSILHLCSSLKSSAFSLEPEKPINVQEASAFLEIPVNTIYGLTSTWKIPFYKPGKNLLFYKSELNEWVKAGRQKTVSEIQTEARNGVKSGK